MASAVNHSAKPKAPAEGSPAEETQDARQASLVARYSTKTMNMSKHPIKMMSRPIKKGPVA